MIKLENTVLPSNEQFLFAIQGMRNPMNSWDKSDSFIYGNEGSSPLCKNCEDCCGDCEHYDAEEDDFYLGEADRKLMNQLAEAGTDHRKFMRQMPVAVRITAPLYWWKEFDTYKIGTVRNSCSTMHKIQDKVFELDDFSCEHLNGIGEFTLGKVIDILNDSRLMFLEMDKKIKESENGNPDIPSLKEKRKECWWQMIQLLPSSYNQTANVTLNYEVLRNIYYSRRFHKLQEWRDFCEWIEQLPYSELIAGPHFEYKR